ncbi:hypothetical protein Cni_G24805 [Canna indica]|uniref:non-specific serine/threonine protein kinase n=1 Tax=Canna indica TaxID=4628 RepID=A0AAQ3KVZ6_9LILI|nr:hypothetical protein Cni_G24805 [Canna indica]
MKGGLTSWWLILGVTIGMVIGVFLALGTLLCIRFRKKRPQIMISSSRRTSTIPMRVNGIDASSVLSDSTMDLHSPELPDPESDTPTFWCDGTKRKNLVSFTGVPKYSYRDLQKATSNFTTLIGQGAFGSVYKAQMPTGEIVAVKVLATNSKQSEKEFQTEVLLLGRLHHRDLVNLVGYCAEKRRHILIYVYMTNGSLASHLYNENNEVLGWDLRVNIALDVARGLEYLHDGAVPPVVHRDIKSENILLDHSMRARVADFGLSKVEMFCHQASSIRGTFGYLDPEYISSRSFTKKSDVYSYGVLLFELITGRNPQQGLMEYVELASMHAEARVGWEEIADPRLDGVFDVGEVNVVAAIAYKCINRLSRKRPAMRDVVQALCRILKTRYRKHPSKRSLPILVDEEYLDLEQSEHQSWVSEHHREESIDSVSDLPDV